MGIYDERLVCGFCGTENWRWTNRGWTDCKCCRLRFVPLRSDDLSERLKTLYPAAKPIAVEWVPVPHGINPPPIGLDYDVPRPPHEYWKSGEAIVRLPACTYFASESLTPGHATVRSILLNRRTHSMPDNLREIGFAWELTIEEWIGVFIHRGWRQQIWIAPETLTLQQDQLHLSFTFELRGQYEERETVPRIGLLPWLGNKTVVQCYPRRECVGIHFGRHRPVV